MKPRCIALIAAAVLVIGASSQAAADDVAVIVNKSNTTDTLSLAQVRKLLLGEETKLGGQKASVFLTAPGLADRTAVIKSACGMSETDFNMHFMQAQFKGETVDAPKALSNAAQLRQAVAGAPGGIGFIRASDVDDSVKVIKINGTMPGQSGYPITAK
jgi:ABC-type phosphate transport system substrate-binding protein